jgi:hypothetical protein
VSRRSNLRISERTGRENTARKLKKTTDEYLITTVLHGALLTLNSPTLLRTEISADSYENMVGVPMVSILPSSRHQDSYKRCST